MLILYAALRYDYGQPAQGDSFEHCNFYDTLRRQGHELIYFDFATELAQRGRDAMNRRLLEIATSEKPDVMFTVLFRDELDPAIIRRISDLPDTTTVNWFCDDHWRFDDFSRRWAPAFNWAVTTDAAAVDRYHAIGYENVIRSQWACNHDLYQKLDLPLRYDVSFVGRPHGNRREVIAALRAQGIRVNVWGTGWGQGRVTTTQMIEIFNQSRINLNLSNASRTSPRSRWRRRGDWARRLGHRLVGKRPDVIAEARRLDAAADHFRPQIKGRNFEVPGCGGFLLTEAAEHLREYYTPGDDIGTFDSFGTLVARIDHYLEHDDERAAASEWGYRRTLRDHTYARRFEEIFQRMGCTPELRHAA